MEVAEHLLKEGYRVLFNVSPAETEILRELELQMPSEKARVASPDLKLLAGVVDLSSLVISNDTGTLHLAGALQRPSIGLYWYVNLLNYGPTTAQTNRVFISWATHCPVCQSDARTHKCGHPASLISEISSEQVIETVNELLNQRS